ncbi:MAG: hypothetical protein R3C61_24265 [Bacteroidia bacterium]
MTNIDMPNIEEYVDVAALGDYQRAMEQGKDMDEFMEQTQLLFERKRAYAHAMG